MAKRLLPFRQYDEKDVINEFFMGYGSTGGGDDGIENPFLNGDNDDGVLVCPGTIQYNLGWSSGSGDNSWTPKVHSSPIGRTGFFYNSFVMAPSSGSVIPIGITLRQTLKYDENGEPLLGRDTKLTELGAVLPYKEVPIATAGIFTLTASAFDAEVDVGDYLTWDLNTTGKFTEFDGNAHPLVLQGRKPIAVVLAKGERSSGDAFPGKYYIIKLDTSMAFKF